MLVVLEVPSGTIGLFVNMIVNHEGQSLLEAVRLPGEALRSGNILQLTHHTDAYTEKAPRSILCLNQEASNGSEAGGTKPSCNAHIAKDTTGRRKINR